VDVHVGLHRLLQHVGGVAGGPEAQHLQRAALTLHPGQQPRQDLLHVLDGVALAELVLLLEDVLVLVDQHRLG
jgi:hypothetical protein